MIQKLSKSCLRVYQCWPKVGSKLCPKLYKSFLLVSKFGSGKGGILGMTRWAGTLLLRTGFIWKSVRCWESVMGRDGYRSSPTSPSSLMLACTLLLTCATISRNFLLLTFKGVFGDKDQHHQQHIYIIQIIYQKARRVLDFKKGVLWKT